MPRYLFQARDGRGELATGVVAAATLDAAGRMLRGEGKFVVNLREVAEESSVDMADRGSGIDGNVKRADVILFCHQLALLIETGVPISEALECLKEQAGNPYFQRVLQEVCDHVQAGGDLSNALKKHPRAFPTIMISLMRASEISGTMGLMLERISRYLDKESRTRRQVRGALMYPLAMIGLSISVTVFLMVFVLPRFASIYQAKQAALPAPTRLLLGISDSLTQHWALWLVGLAGGVSAARWFATGALGRRCIDRAKLTAPVFGHLFTQLYLSRACRSLSTMINSGVPLLDAIGIVRCVTENVHYDKLWDDVDHALRQGLQMSDPLSKCPFMPRTAVQMIRSGERSGKLSQVLSRMADFAEEELDQTVKTTTQFIEPVMVIVMGSMVGFIAISLLLPIFSISTVMSK